MIQDDKHFKKILFVMLFLVGIATFMFAIIGYTTTPWYDEDIDNWRCTDWAFHECYADTNDLDGCCKSLSDETNRTGTIYEIHYDYYPPYLHYGAKAISIVSGLPVAFGLAIIAAIAVMLLALVLLVRSGFIGFLMYFSIIPLALVLVFVKMPFTWVDAVACGSFPFLIAISLFVFLLFEWRKLPFPVLFLLFVLMALIHNMGYILNMFLILSVAFSWFILRDSSLAHIVAIIVTFVWIMVFANTIYPTNSIRIAFLLYFLVSFQVGLYVEGVLDRRKKRRKK